MGLMHNAFVALVAYQVMMALVLTVERQWYRLADLAKVRGWWLLAASALFGLLAGVSLYVLAPLLGLTAGLAPKLAAIGLTAATWPWFIGVFVLTNPWLEELYWRGYLGSDSVTPVWTDAWFSGYHVIMLLGFVPVVGLAAAFVLLFACGWAWRQSARATGDLMFAGISHFAADLSLLITVWALAVLS
jgi:membrane protease YdiL (CAAX protease family)